VEKGGKIYLRASLGEPSPPTSVQQTSKMLDRRAAPPIHEVRHLILPRPERVLLDNGIPVHVLDFPGQEILKIEAVFRAGRPQEEKRLAARATSRLVREGTVSRSAADIAEHFDYFGASLNAPTNLDTANFLLFTLKKYAHEVIPLFAEVLQQPSFPEEEIETFRRTNVQELLVELDKVETLAYRKVTELIFGEDHPYGYNSTAADYAAIGRTDILHFFERWYTPTNCTLFASGRVDDAALALLNQYFGQTPKTGQVPENQPLEPPKLTPTTLKIPHKDSLQTAIKIGRRAFSRQHPDFDGLFVLNTILGGYFGSRLMSNVREKKGFTYNIYSTLDTYAHDGCFYIATEVSPDKAEATRRAIFSEMKKLRTQPVDAEELAMVRNYLLGMLLNGLDGPLNTSDVVRSLVTEGLSWERFDQLVATIRDISPAELQALAERYLRPEDFWTVMVG
jgi:predicted Zn-dependent peptidase